MSDDERRLIDQELASAGLPGLGRHAWVEVDIGQLTANAGALREMVAPAALGVVVKADGYGHGMEMAARCAVNGGAEWLCVATVGEALRLRRDGYGGRTFVMYPPPAGMLETAAAEQIDVSVGGLKEAVAIGSRRASARPLRVHVEVDTGMTRGGVAPSDVVEVVALLDQASGCELVAVWSHLATPEDGAATSRQVDLFTHVLGELQASGLAGYLVHLAASGGILALDSSVYSLVRPGLAFYGLHPGAGRALPEGMAPAMTVKARPVRVSPVPAGTAVGYGGDWVADRATMVATLPIGYADGWSRSSSPGGCALVEGRVAPFVGRISSDSLVVDVTDVPGIDTSSEFVLLGSQGGESIGADEVAAIRSTISWEVVQQLGSRLARVYRSGGVPIAMRPESAIDVVRVPADAAGRYGQ